MFHTYSGWAAQLTQQWVQQSKFPCTRQVGTRLSVCRGHQGPTRLPLTVAHLSSVRVGVKSGRPVPLSSIYTQTAVQWTRKQSPSLPAVYEIAHVEQSLLDNAITWYYMTGMCPEVQLQHCLQMHFKFLMWRTKPWFKATTEGADVMSSVLFLGFWSFYNSRGSLHPTTVLGKKINTIKMKFWDFAFLQNDNPGIVEKPLKKNLDNIAKREELLWPSLTVRALLLLGSARNSQYQINIHQILFCHFLHS